MENNNLIAVNEKSLNRIIDKHGYNGYAIVSAYRNDKTPAENRENHLALIDDVNKAGFAYMKMFGGFIEDINTDNPIEVKEPVLFITNFKRGSVKPLENTDELKKLAMDLCVKYNQDSILFKDIDSEPKYIDKEGNVDFEFSGNLSTNNTSEPYFTSINKNNNGRLTYKECYIVKAPNTFSQRHISFLKGEIIITERFLNS